MYEQPENLEGKGEGSYEGFEDLPFDTLQKIYGKAAELAPRTFREVDDGFENILGEKIIVSEKSRRFYFSPRSDRKFHNSFGVHELRHGGAESRETAHKIILERLEDQGYRVIE